MRLRERVPSRALCGTSSSTNGSILGVRGRAGSGTGTCTRVLSAPRSRTISLALAHAEVAAAARDAAGAASRACAPRACARLAPLAHSASSSATFHLDQSVEAKVRPWLRAFQRPSSTEP